MVSFGLGLPTFQLKKAVSRIATFLMCVLFSLPSHALTIEVNQGNFNPIPLALTPFKSETKRDQDLSTKILDVIKSDLGGTGLFKLIPPSDFIENPNSMGPIPRFADWRLLEAQGLTTGKINPSTKPAHAQIEMRLWDVFSERQIEGKALSGPESSYRSLAHRLSNLIYKRMLGEEGHFDTKIVYVSESAPNTLKNKRRLAIMDYDGANHAYLSNDRTIVLTPRFSPTKPEIVYMSYEGTTPQVYLLDLITGKHVPLGKFPGMTFAPRFSPDGEHVIFSQSLNGLTSIYEMNLRTKRTRQITRSPSIDTSPCYAPNGSKIVFNSDRSGTQQLYTMNPDGSDIKRISFGEGRYATPVWSPRGDLIAFTKMHAGTFYIGLMKPDGSGERWIASGYVVEEPSWSPNGRMLSYSHQTKGVKGKSSGQALIQVVDTTGRINKTLTLPQNGSGADWSGFTTFGPSR